MNWALFQDIQDPWKVPEFQAHQKPMKIHNVKLIRKKTVESLFVYAHASS